MRRLAPELLVTAKTQRWKPEEFLRTLIEVYNGGPVGIEAIAATMGEERDTLEDVIERPYGVIVVYRKLGVFAERPGLTVEVFETTDGLVTRNVVYWGVEEVASRFGRPHS